MTRIEPTSSCHIWHSPVHTILPPRDTLGSEVSCATVDCNFALTLCVRGREAGKL